MSKELIRFRGEIKTPPFSSEAHIESGYLLRLLQEGVLLSMPHSRPMPSIGAHVHELRVRDEGHNWRIIYRIDAEEIVIVEVFNKTTQETPKAVIDTCKARLSAYDAL